MTFKLGLALLVVTTTGLAAPAGDFKSSIRAAYFKSTKATGLKFIDGIYSIRARNFRLFDVDNNPVDLALERQRMQTLLDTALEARETFELVSVSQSGSGSVNCVVTYRTEFTRPDKKIAKPTVLVLETTSQDTWELMNQAWMQTRSRVVSARTKRLEPSTGGQPK